MAAQGECFMATQPPPENPQPPAQPVQPDTPPAEINPPNPDIDQPAPDTHPGTMPGNNPPVEI
jgi:hypothetical protein